jgi:hypothetical protein
MNPQISILLAIESCQRDRDRGFHEAIRDTWLDDLIKVEKWFFMGRDFGLEHGVIDENEDEVLLDVSDSYDTLSIKTQRICQWAVEKNFDYIFKCDVDTFVNPRKFSIFGGLDYMGGENADVNVPGFAPNRIEFCSGGAGYWLSKKSLTLIAESDSIKTSAEDVFVADALLKHGIKPTFHPGYQWRPGAVIDKDTVTLHLSSALQKKYEPAQMYEAYRQIKETQ